MFVNNLPIYRVSRSFNSSYKVYLLESNAQLEDNKSHKKHALSHQVVFVQSSLT